MKTIVDFHYSNLRDSYPVKGKIKDGIQTVIFYATEQDAIDRNPDSRSRFILSWGDLLTEDQRQIVIANTQQRAKLTQGLE